VRSEGINQGLDREVEAMVTYLLVKRVLVKFKLDEEFELPVELLHEFGTGGDSIAIE
jgi:hypothetical protein